MKLLSLVMSIVFTFQLVLAGSFTHNCHQTETHSDSDQSNSEQLESGDEHHHHDFHSHSHESKTTSLHDQSHENSESTDNQHDCGCRSQRGSCCAGVYLLGVMFKSFHIHQVDNLFSSYSRNSKAEPVLDGPFQPPRA